MSTTTIDVDTSALQVVHELRVTAAEMAWLANAALVATDKDPENGALHHVRVVAEQFEMVATSSDRFRVHELRLPLRAPVDHVDVVVPREVFAWAVKNARTFKPKKDALLEPVATIELVVPAFSENREKHPGTVALIFHEWEGEGAPSARFDSPLFNGPAANYSAVIDNARVFETSEPTPVNLEYIADAAKLRTPDTLTPTMQYTVTAEGKNGPIIIDFWEEHEVLRATALITSQTGGADQ